MSDPFMKLADVVAETGISRDALKRTIMRGELVAHKLCNRWVIRRSEYDAWLERNLVTPSLDAPRVPTPPPGPRQGLRARLEYHPTQ